MSESRFYCIDDTIINLDHVSLVEPPVTDLNGRKFFRVYVNGMSFPLEITRDNLNGAIAEYTVFVAALKG